MACMGQYKGAHKLDERQEGRLSRKHLGQQGNAQLGEIIGSMDYSCGLGS